MSQETTMNALTPIVNEMPAFRAVLRPDHTQFYAAAFYDGQEYPIAGPYQSLDYALSRVGEAAAYAIARHPICALATFGVWPDYCIMDTHLGEDF
jgi:hypothetical protein